MFLTTRLAFASLFRSSSDLLCFRSARRPEPSVSPPARVVRTPLLSCGACAHSGYIRYRSGYPSGLLPHLSGTGFNTSTGTHPAQRSPIAIEGRQIISQSGDNNSIGRILDEVMDCGLVPPVMVAKCIQQHPPEKNRGARVGRPSMGKPRWRSSHVSLSAATSQTKYDDCYSAISCTVVVKQRQRAGIQYFFSNLEVDSWLLRSEVASGGKKTVSIVTFSALLGILQHRSTASGSQVPPPIRAILLGTAAANVRVATSRSFDFSQGTYQRMCNGYRDLGPLSDIPTSIDYHLPNPTYEERLDVISVDASHQDTSAILDLWEPMGAQRDAHFVVFFEFMPPTSITQHYSSALEHTISVSTPPRSARWTPYSIPSPSPHSPSCSWSPVSSSPSSTATASQSPLNTVSVLLAYCNPDDVPQLRIKAHYVKGGKNTGLARLAINYYAMHEMLCCVQGGVDLSQNITVLSNGTGLNAAGMLSAFGWSMSTFRNKFVIYSNAEVISKRSWDGTIPDFSNGPLLTIYHQFEAMRLLWGSTGVKDLHAFTLPSPTSTDAAERQAALFKEFELNNALLNKIKNHTMYKPDRGRSTDAQTSTNARSGAKKAVVSVPGILRNDEKISRTERLSLGIAIKLSRSDRIDVSKLQIPRTRATLPWRAMRRVCGPDELLSYTAGTHTSTRKLLGRGMTVGAHQVKR
ncbi:hypothetical protein C8F01DRAFT_1329158 [Mycena amicta]|nr:hypothetical protein C8F01DRAFT_1329158 [Mycena amicta]